MDADDDAFEDRGWLTVVEVLRKDENDFILTYVVTLRISAITGVENNGDGQYAPAVIQCGGREYKVRQGREQIMQVIHEHEAILVVE